MNTYEKLLEEAAESGIIILEDGGITASIKMDNSYAISIFEHMCDNAELEEALAHEIGHCKTGSFYSSRSSRSTIRKCEHMANLWAAMKLLPPWHLSELVHSGATEIHELSERTGRSEAFIRRAVDYYRSKGLLTEL